MEIRELTLSDVKYKSNLVMLLKIAFLNSFENIKFIDILSEQKIESLFCYLKDQKARCLIAIKEDKVVGMCWFFKIEELGQEMYHINNISVEKLYQGKGIAKKFINILEKICLEEGVNLIDLKVSSINTKALEFYERNKFLAERIIMRKKVGK